MTSIAAIIFDLDDTLFDCTGLLTDAARRRAAACLVEKTSGPETAQTLMDLQADLSERLGSTEALFEIGNRLALGKADVEQAVAAYNRDAAEAIHTFPEVPETLTELENRGYRMAVVTAGSTDRQRLKIERLNLATRFSEPDGSLWIHDAEGDKGPLLRAAADRMGFDPPQILSVGDKLDADIAVSNRLGMCTARLLHGRQKDRSPSSSDETPDFTLTRLSDLLLHLPAR